MLGPASRALDGNQSWWESLSTASPGPARRTQYKNAGIRLFAMTCGWLRADLKMMLAGTEGTIRFPVPAYLIEHPKGRVLFDTGLHPQSQHDAHGRIGELANFFHVEFRPGEDIKSRLEQLEVDADRIDYVINSHLHFDHTGGNELVPNARIVIQEQEWEAGHLPELIEANGFNPNDYEHGHLVKQITGEFDLFGDGTVVTVPTFGHTPRTPVAQYQANTKERCSSGGPFGCCWSGPNRSRPGFHSAPVWTISMLAIGCARSRAKAGPISTLR